MLSGRMRYPEELASRNEQAKVAEIRAALTPELLSSLGYSFETHPDILGDVRILRCVRAFSPADCKTRFLDSLHMRKTLKVDDARAKALEIIERKGLYGWDVEDLAYGPESRPYIPDMCLNAGKSASGAPFFTENLATSNYDGFLIAYGHRAYLSFLTSFLELRQIQLERASRSAYIRQIVIMIVDNSLQFFSRKIVAFLRAPEAKQLFACYQELTLTNYLIDSPWVFQTAYNSIRSLLPLRIQAKVNFISRAKMERNEDLSREVRLWFGFDAPPAAPGVCGLDESLDPYGCKLQFWEELKLRPEALPSIAEAVIVARVAILLFGNNLFESARRVLKGSILDIGIPTARELEAGCRELIFLEDVLLRKPFTLDKLVAARRYLDNFLRKWKEEPGVPSDRVDLTIELDSRPVQQSCALNLPRFPSVPRFLTQWMS